MKLNVNYLKRISACYKAIEYYKEKYGNKEVDVMTAYNEACTNWQVWFLWNANTKILKYLIKNGADVNIKDDNGDTALMWASWNGHYDIAKLLIDNGADVNAKDEYGRTTLMWASSRGHTDIVRLLIDAGADVNASDGDGYTALMYAIRTDIIELLRSKGAK